MNTDYRPQILIYFDELEARYGQDFTFDALKCAELQRLEKFTRHAIELDTHVADGDKQNLRALLTLIEKQITYRQRFSMPAKGAVSG